MRSFNLENFLESSWQFPSPYFLFLEILFIKVAPLGLIFKTFSFSFMFYVTLREFLHFIFHLCHLNCFILAATFASARFVLYGCFIAPCSFSVCKVSFGCLGHLSFFWHLPLCSLRFFNVVSNPCCNEFGARSGQLGGSQWALLWRAHSMWLQGTEHFVVEAPNTTLWGALRLGYCLLMWYFQSSA